MNFVLADNLLLAVRDKMFRNLGSGFREKEANFDPVETFMWIGLLVVAVIVAGFIVRFIARRYESELYNSPRGLFGGLCRAHQLSTAQRRLLLHVARAQQLDLAARVFLEPERLEQARGTAQFAAQRAELARLEHKLFAGMESDTPLPQNASPAKSQTPLVPPLDFTSTADGASAPLLQ